MPRAAVPFVVLLRTDFGENATRGQAIPVTTFDANVLIPLANDTMLATHPACAASPFPELLRARHMPRMTNRRAGPPIALTIAGSDSGGGAGIQADLRTFAAHGVHGLSAITAVTAQNTRRVAAIETLKPAMVRAELDAVFSDFDIKAIKIGMLATPAIVRTVAAALGRWTSIPVVLDPVLVATTGARLARGDLAAPIRRHLLARADLVTPNIPEAETLLGRKIRAARDLPGAAADLIAHGARAVLLKGGHLRGSHVIDLFLTSNGVRREFRHPRIRVEGHGTGCTLSSAIAANLALGESMGNAVHHAIDYVHRAIAAGYEPGRGKLRVLDHSAGLR
jgi:hydroxymethylpyrimidine/phosphomethylpyrimidine kinase